MKGSLWFWSSVVLFFRKYIIATDLATFFPNQKFLTGLLDNNELDINNPVHRDGVFSLIMTSSDLCAICKPWETQKKTAQLIYDEFYMQVIKLKVLDQNVLYEHSFFTLPKLPF